jgi:hypothetical protein
MTTTAQNLKFFNGLSAILKITLTEATEAISPNLENQKATPTARIESLELTPSVFLRENSEFRDLTPEELALVVLEEKSIRLRGLGEAVEHEAPNGESFTVADLLAAIAATERQTRDQSEWFDGVDVHHVFFEGIRRGDDGIWRARWGS